MPFACFFFLLCLVLLSFLISSLKKKTYHNRYEVAPRSDSEESGSEFEEEVSDSEQPPKLSTFAASVLPPVKRYWSYEQPVLHYQCHCFQEEEDAGKAESEETTVDANGDKVTAAEHIIE